ncbi:MAG: RecA-family ATPase [Oleiphilaceae bacterium]|jgi:RecA-family ATPase
MSLNIPIPHDDPRLRQINTAQAFKPFTPPAEPLPCISENRSVFQPIDASQFTNTSSEPRQWLIKNMSQLGYISMLVAAGGTGKSILSIVMAISVATGRDLLGLTIPQRANVLLINNEDDYKELHRRISAIAQYFGVLGSELEGKLFIQSGYDSKVIIASELDGAVIEGPNLHDIKQFITKNKIKQMMIDPFVSIHQCNENDNVKMDAVMSIMRGIAGQYQINIIIIHHIPKVGGLAISGNAEAARGASAVKDACRSVFTLENCPVHCAEDYGIPLHDVQRVKLLQDAKTNFSLATNSPTFIYMESVILTNGEKVGVPHKYNPTKNIKEEKPNSEQVKSRVILDIAQATHIKLGADGGKIKATELYAVYMSLTSYSKSKTEMNFTLLPIGSIKSHLINFDNLSYRIFQTKEDKKTAPRYVHLEAQN